jgi:hypothetical protein
MFRYCRSTNICGFKISFFSYSKFIRQDLILLVLATLHQLTLWLKFRHGFNFTDLFFQ